MTSMNAREAREKLYRLLDETVTDHFLRSSTIRHPDDPSKRLGAVFTDSSVFAETFCRYLRSEKEGV